MRLEGRTALVTGASQGLGKTIALRFAREGAKVVLAARSPECLADTAAEIEAAGGWALAVPTDLREPAEIGAVAQRVEAELGGIDAHARETPLGRFVPPEDVAAAAAFLASDDSASITGDELNVSRGLAMH